MHTTTREGLRRRDGGGRREGEGKKSCEEPRYITSRSQSHTSKNTSLHLRTYINEGSKEMKSSENKKYIPTLDSFSLAHSFLSSTSGQGIFTTSPPLHRPKLPNKETRKYRIMGYQTINQNSSQNIWPDNSSESVPHKPQENASPTPIVVQPYSSKISLKALSSTTSASTLLGTLSGGPIPRTLPD